MMCTDSILSAQAEGELVGYVRRMVGSEDVARDVVQSAYECLLEHRSRVWSAEGWLHTTAHRLALDHLRERKRRPRGRLEALPAPGNDEWAADPQRRIETTQQIERMLQPLPGPQQQLVVLHCFYGLSCREIAGARLAAGEVVTKQVVKMFERRVSRAMKQCRRHLQRA